MSYNIYKQLPKLREYLKNEGYESNIPYEVFLKNLMLFFGMSMKRGRLWFQTFEELGLIRVTGDGVNWV